MTLAERHLHYCPPGEPDECWPWRGFMKNEYGGICVGGNGKGSVHRGAHVVAWELAHDRRVPKGWQVRHRCDNPPCCNPRHLVVGPPLLNARDRERRNPGTQARGEAAGPSKLTESAVREIREMSSAGVGQRRLAERFGVNQSAISLIVNRKTWTHI
jgi:hypothetical protein